MGWGQKRLIGLAIHYFPVKKKITEGGKFVCTQATAKSKTKYDANVFSLELRVKNILTVLNGQGSAHIGDVTGGKCVKRTVGI